MSLRNIVISLRNPNYRIFAGGNAISLVGTWMQRIAVGWLAWDLTHSGLWLGLVAFADLFPTVLFGPFAGAAADRWDRLRVTRITQSFSSVQAIALAGLTVSGHITIWLLFALTGLIGIVNAFNQPARLALMPSLVPRSDLATAVAVNSLIFNIARFVGPAVAGLLIVAVDVSAAFIAIAFAYAVFSYALSRLRISPQPPPPPSTDGYGPGAIGGIRYVYAQIGMWRILSLMIVTGCGLRPVVELMPGFAAEIFEHGAAGLAILTSSMGIASIAAGLWLGGRGTKGLTNIVIVSSCLVSLAVMSFVTFGEPWAAILALMVAGYGLSASGIGTQTLIQLAVDDRMRGRVLGIYGLIFRGGPALGALIMGLLSERYGLHGPLLCSAFLVLCLSLWTLLKRDSIISSLEE